MTIAILVIILAVVVYLIVARLRARARETSVQNYERYVRRLSEIAGSPAQAEEVPAHEPSVLERRYFGLPPLGVVAGALAAVAFVVGVVALAVAATSGGSARVAAHGSSSHSSRPRKTLSISHHGSTSTSTTVAAIEPLSTSGTLTYKAPVVNYSLVVRATYDTWVEVVDASGKVLLAEIVPPGGSVSVQVSGPCKVTLGKSEVSVSLNGVPLAPPSGGFPTNVAIETPSSA